MTVNPTELLNTAERSRRAAPRLGRTAGEQGPAQASRAALRLPSGWRLAAANRGTAPTAAAAQLTPARPPCCREETKGLAGSGGTMSPGGRTFQIVVAATKSWGIGKGERCGQPAAACQQCW